jgi:predicted RNA methylase
MSRVEILVFKIKKEVGEKGLLQFFMGVCRRLVKYLRPEKNELDRKFGTRTSRPRSLINMTIVSDNLADAVYYKVSEKEELERALDKLPGDLSTFTIIDLGCGCAFVLLTIWLGKKLGQRNSGFGKIVGVEFAKELAELARRNVNKIGAEKEIEIVQGDAALYKFPAGNLLVYLYNPFGIYVMGKVVQNLKDHLQISPGAQVFVLYRNPVLGSMFDQFMNKVSAENTSIWKNKS